MSHYGPNLILQKQIRKMETYDSRELNAQDFTLQFKEVLYTFLVHINMYDFL